MNLPDLESEYTSAIAERSALDAELVKIRERNGFASEELCAMAERSTARRDNAERALRKAREQIELDSERRLRTVAGGNPAAWIAERVDEAERRQRGIEAIGRVLPVLREVIEADDLTGMAGREAMP